MMRWKGDCAYDGRYFLGWQSQAGGGAVQDVIENGLQRILRKAARVHGSSRTDTGVHAKNQVFHFDAEWPHGPDRLEAAIRTVLPESIQVKNVKCVPDTFHARYSAKGKRYRYYIMNGRADPFEAPFHWSIPRELSVTTMREAADLLVGRHDFSSFAASSGGNDEDPVKDLRILTVVQRGSRIIITAEASGFMYKMVRGLAGGLVNVGIGKLTPDRLREILDQRQRTHIIETAPPHGLFLEKVYYRTPKHW